jgi:hypothetical protein
LAPSDSKNIEIQKKKIVKQKFLRNIDKTKKRKEGRKKAFYEKKENETSIKGSHSFFVKKKKKSKEEKERKGKERKDMGSSPYVSMPFMEWLTLGPEIWKQTYVHMENTQNLLQGGSYRQRQCFLCSSFLYSLLEKGEKKR